MKRQLLRVIDRLDDHLASRTLSRRRERPALLGFLFHGIFADEAEVAGGDVWPSQPLLVDELARFIAYFRDHGYRFVRPADLLAGLEPDGRYALLTFDDGYASNRRALPVLRALSVPATFFVSAGHVVEGRAFWWDVLYREQHRRNASFEAIRREMAALRRRAPESIEADLRARFGVDALRPVGELDRPFSPAELRDFAADPWVTIGNHTVTHAELPYQDEARIVAEIGEGQRTLTELTGTAPPILAYPNGAYDARCIAAAAAAGLRLAVAVGRGKTRLPLTRATAMTIERAFITCGAGLDAASRRARSDVQLRRRLERWWRRV